MKSKNILILGILAVIALAVIYTITGTESPEVYQEKIEKEREKQFKFIKFNIDSPLDEQQKKEFKDLEFFPIDPNYKVRAKDGSFGRKEDDGTSNDRWVCRKIPQTFFC
jgi:uncharacterized protein